MLLLYVSGPPQLRPTCPLHNTRTYDLFLKCSNVAYAHRGCRRKNHNNSARNSPNYFRRAECSMNFFNVKFEFPIQNYIVGPVFNKIRSQQFFGLKSLNSAKSMSQHPNRMKSQNFFNVKFEFPMQNSIPIPIFGTIDKFGTNCSIKLSKMKCKQKV